MNNILNKIAQMERNAAEIKGVELSKHQVHLSLMDDINENYKRIYALRDEAFNLVKQAEDKFKSIVDRAGLMESIAEKGIQMTKELGIDPKEFIQRKNDAQENSKKFSKYLNLLK
jgi:predicted methyltransferase